MLHSAVKTLLATAIQATPYPKIVAIAQNIDITHNMT